MRRIFLPATLLSFIGLSGSCLAQTPPASKTVVVQPADQYASEPLVIEKTESVYRMQANGLGVREKTVVARIQSEAALKEIAVIGVGFAGNSEHAEWVYARLRHKDGSVTETPVANAMEQAAPVTRAAPFYSDIKELQLPLRDLRVGDRLEWKYRVTRTRAEAEGQFWGQENFGAGVVLAETIELDVPKASTVNVWSLKSKPVEADNGDRHTYRWSSSSLKPTVGPAADAAKEAEKKRIRTPEEEIDEREGKLPDVAWTTFKSWEEVGAWYRGLEGERMHPDAEIKAKVAQLTAGKTTELEKVQAVYGYVATQIHYIGVAFGIGRYQPHSAGDVLSNQYGDCKDKHTLLAAMLEALGLHPDAVLIGAGVRFNTAVPSPAAFNHLITHLTLDGKPVWLDTTAEVAPFNMLIFVTRDHDALIVPETGKAHVEKTPKHPPFTPMDSMDSKVSIDADGVRNSRITMTMRGDGEILMRSVIRQLSPAQYDLVAQQIATIFPFTGKASRMEIGSIDDTSVPLTFSFDFKNTKPEDWSSLQTIPEFAPVTLPRPDENDPPVESVALGEPHTETSHIELKIPDGWTAELPEAIHAKSEWGTFDQTFRFEKGTVYGEQKLVTLKDRVEQADWKAYNKFAQKANPGSNSYIQLVRKPGEKPKGSTAVKTDGASTRANNAEAAKLIDDAYRAMQQQHDTETAKTLLDQAKALNPEQRRLWGNYGDIARSHGDVSGAIEDYDKELTLHPSAVNVYPVLVRMLIASGRKKDAVERLQRWTAASPGNPAPLMTLAGMQFEDEDFAGAVSTATTAIALTPEGKEPNPQFLLELGRAQLKAGMKDKGHETLLSLMNKSEDPGMMNNAAYELADAGLELPRAEKITRDALDKMEEESKAWTLDENLQNLRAKTQLMQATWDTMGWVAFKQGKNDVAEGYVKASWLGRQSAEVGLHLGQIQESRGDKNAALATYNLAEASVANFDAMGVRKEPNSMQKDLTARAAALRKAGAKSSVKDANSALSKMRVYPMGPGSNAVAEYKILLGANGIVRAEATGDKEVPNAEARMKLAKLGALLPPGSQAQIVLSVMFNCHSGNCEIYVTP